MAKRWKFTAGVRPNTVTVYEREPGGTLHMRMWDPNKRAGKGNTVRRSLGHTDRRQARDTALQMAAQLTQGEQVEHTIQAASLASVFDQYLRHRTPRKASQEKQADQRRVELFSSLLGDSEAPDSISMRQWERFCDLRLSGAIDAWGRAVSEPRPVRSRTVEADCRWLVHVFNWASKWRLNSGRYLMAENPIRGFPILKERNPRRPVATQDRFEALRAVSDQVMMEARWDGTRTSVRSHLSELLDVANGTGRRIRAICRLKVDDLLLHQPPYGAIRWPADTDKAGRTTMAPIHPDVRRAINRALSREYTGDFLFHSPTDPLKPITRYLASRWLRKAEQLAGLEPLQGGLWHPFRRKWATERKHLPDVDVAAVGGWKSLEALKKSYQHADHETMLRVVLEGGQLRENGS